MEMYMLEDEAPLLQLFWLEDPPEGTITAIIRTLFGWEDCLVCEQAGTCVQGTCTWSRRRHLDPYFEFYKAVASWSTPEDLVQGHPALRDHNDLKEIVKLIQQHPDTPRNELMQAHFCRYETTQPDDVDQSRSFDLALRILTMIECSPMGCPLVNWKPGFAPNPWYANDSARQYINKVFPRHPPFDPQRKYGQVILDKLAATSLVSRSKIKLVGTHDLQKHLLLDTVGRNRTLYIYHHVSFLREYLAATKDTKSNIREVLPRQLALETIHSLQNILFPWHDRERHALVEKANLDSGCLQLEAIQYWRESEFNSEYHYWGDRFKVLCEELERPSRIRVCFRAASSKRSLMLITAIGVFFAAGELIRESLKH